MQFSEALTLIRDDRDIAITREGWNGRALGKMMFVKTQMPDSQSAMTDRYLYMFIETAGSGRGYTRVPWVPSQQDLFADDWKEMD
jgi:hypothetical protein